LPYDGTGLAMIASCAWSTVPSPYCLNDAV
jgi:hypothetical protein